MNEKNDSHQKKAKPDPDDDDVIIELTEEIEIKSEDDEDVILLDEMDANLAADKADTKMDAAVFDLGEEIELKQQNDEDNFDFFDIEADEADEEKDRLSLLENLDLVFGEEDDIIALDADRVEKSASLALKSEDASGTNQADDLPDLLAEMEFEFEEDDDAEDIIALDEHPAEADNNFIARAVEQSVASDKDADRIVFTDRDEEAVDDSEALALDETQFEDDDIIPPEQTKITNLELEEDLLNFEDNINLKPEDDIISKEESDAVNPERADDIIEITEFDQHFPEEDEKIFEQAGVLDSADEEDDEFLELIEIEEDDSPADETGMTSDDSDMKIADAQISRFLSETFEEDAEFKGDVLWPAEEPSTLSSEKATDAEVDSSEDEEFSFDLNTQEISQHIDGLDVFLSDAPSAANELAPLSEDQPEEEEPESEVAFLSEDQAQASESAPEVVSLSEDHPEEEEPAPEAAILSEGQAQASEPAPEVVPLSEDHPEEEEPEPKMVSFPEDHLGGEEPAPEMASLAEDQPAEKEALQEDMPAIHEPGEYAAVTPELVSAAIERVINEKFSSQIERIIYEVIEKAVVKEIDRLKAALLEGGNLDDNP